MTFTNKKRNNSKTDTQNKNCHIEISDVSIHCSEY